MYDELRHLVLIVEHGTFTEAAKRAHLSQPALSASIRRLEESFGAKLLHRGRQGARLTAAGRSLLPRARASLAALEDGRRAVAEVVGLRAGEVRLGAGTTAATYLLPEVLAKFRERHPAVRYVLREVTAVQAVQALERDELDLAVVTAPQHEAWFTDELILVAAPGVDARRAPFVALLPGASSRDLLEHHFPEADIIMELGSLSSVKGNVWAGTGVALISRHAVINDLAEGRLVRVRDRRTPIRRPLMLAHRGATRLPPAAAALRRLLRSPAGTAHLRRRRA